MTRYTKFIMTVLFVTYASYAWADPTVMFNGVDVTGLQNQKFTNVTVEFDAQGNIILTAPHYRLSNASPQTPSAPSPTYAAPSPTYAAPSPTYAAPSPTYAAPSPTYAAPNPSLPIIPDDRRPVYLVAQFDSPGLLGYNVDVYVNGKFVKTFDQGTAQQVADISSYLVKGKNTLQYQLVLAADSGSLSVATVSLSMAKMTNRQGNALELSGQYAYTRIKGADGAKLYTVEFLNQN